MWVVGCASQATHIAMILFPADLVGVALDELPADTRIMAEAL